MTPSAILTYHSIDRSGSVISIAPESFKRQMEVLAESGAEVVPLSRIQNSGGSVAITFDDGYANFEEHALPVLAKYKFPATVFLVSGHCGGSNVWTAGPRLPLMSWPAIRGLTGDIAEWGAHTVSHPDLTEQPHERVTDELVGCRAEIENQTGTRVTAFAYPFGLVNAGVRGSVAEHFELACGTRLDYVNRGADSFGLPRLDMYYFRQPAGINVLLGPSGRFYTGVRRFLRERRSWFFQ